jgi:hypothetical protein
MSNPRGVSIVHPAAGAPIEFLWWRDDGSCERREISPRYALQVAADLLVAARVNLAASELEK